MRIGGAKGLDITSARHGSINKVGAAPGEPLRIQLLRQQIGRQKRQPHRTASSSNPCIKPFCLRFEFTFHRTETLHFIGASPER